jgi:hypothetical protein
MRSQLWSQWPAPSPRTWSLKDMAIGDLVRQICNGFGWSVATRTVILEGDTDERYLKTAARIIKLSGGPSLLDKDFQVTSCGSGHDGGIPNLVERFIAVRQVADNIDRFPNGSKSFHFIAMFDGDTPGRRAALDLESQVARFALGRDILILQHKMPAVGGTAEHVQTTIKKANNEHSALGCVIEDLVDDDLYDCFVYDELGGQPVPCDRAGNYCHRRRVRMPS